MSEISSSFLFMMIFLFIFPAFISQEDINNTNENPNETFNGTFNETLNDTFENDEKEYDYNPFKNFDFGNLLWLDDTNATSEMQKYDLLFVTFYSPWCQHCHAFMPEYVKTSKYAEEKNLTVKFAKIDSSVSQNISEEFGIEGIPSVFLIYKGKRHIFEGERTKEGLLKFMDRKINNDIYKIDTLSQLKEYLNSSSLVLLSTLKNEDTILYQSFLNFSKMALYIDFIVCKTEECIKEYKEDIILFKKFDEKINIYTKEMGSIADAKPNSIEEFIGTYAIETGAELNATQINMMFQHQRKMLFYFRNSSLEEYTKFDKIIKELGKEFRKEKIYTVVSDIEGNPLQQNVAQTFVIVKQDLPTLLFYDLSRNVSDDQDFASLYSLKPATKEQLSKEYIKEYINDIKNKKIRKDLYSEPPLDNYYHNGLKIVIGRTYDKDVIDEKRNVFITLIDGTFINPESKKVLDIMANLTKKYKTEEKNIVFAYMDAGRNQPRNIEVQGNNPPLVLLYTNAMSEKKIIHMKDKNFTEITEEEIEDFIYENLNWGKRPTEETKENKKNKENNKPEDDNKKEEKKESKESIKQEETNKKEEKKEAQTDL